MYCKHCGKVIDNDSAFCKYYGKTQDLPKERRRRPIRPSLIGRISFLAKKLFILS